MCRQIAKIRQVALVAVTLLEVVPISPSAAARELVPLTAACSFFGEALPPEAETAPSTGEVPRLIAKIVDVSGLKQNFTVRVAPVPNASAVIADGQRYILFNPLFMHELAALNGRIWPALSVLAHEVGHHLNGHTLSADGSRPAIELEADYFSGFVLQRLGAPAAEASLVMERLAPPAGGPTHPARDARVQSVIEGWGAACRTDPDCMTMSGGEAAQPQDGDGDVDKVDDAPPPSNAPAPRSSLHFQ